MLPERICWSKKPFAKSGLYWYGVKSLKGKYKTVPCTGGKLGSL